MQLYRGTVREMREDLLADKLVQRLGQRFLDQFFYPPSDSEARSWEHSLAALAPVLESAGLSEAEVLVEYQLPLTSKRIDVLVVGTDPAGGVAAVVVENKQWTVGEIEDIEGRTVRVAGRSLLHPQQQVAQYVEYLTDFNSLAHDGTLTVSGCAFLHNATETQVAELRSAQLADVAAYPIFTGDELGAMRSFLSERVRPEGAAEATDRFLAARTRPSKRLLDHVDAQLRGQPAFTLLDEQLVAYDVVRTAVNESRRSNTKKAVIVVGGPGTGKSVIALQLLADLAKAGRNVTHATGSKSFTETLRQLTGRKAGQVFRYFNQFSQAEPNDIDVIVADEAHRIRETSNSRFTPRSQRSDLPQADELMQAARVPVFLLDERQVVRPNEIGTVEAITAAAERCGATVEIVSLNGQFRAAGSEGYVEWVNDLLEFDDRQPTAWASQAFQLGVAESPEEIESWIRRVDGTDRTARMSAGFCWPWSDPTRDGHLVADVAINGWVRPWNAKPDKKVIDAPSASLWATDPRGIGQVGCIYTAQGFEYDYAGVIFGPDLVRRDGQWVARPEHSHDRQVSRDKANFDRLIKHTYKVLLTRGLIGCRIYSTDEETQRFFRSVVPVDNATS